MRKRTSEVVVVRPSMREHSARAFVLLHLIFLHSPFVTAYRLTVLHLLSLMFRLPEYRIDVCAVDGTVFGNVYCIASPFPAPLPGPSVYQVKPRAWPLLRLNY